jgi:cytochrome c oxidase assembly factor CtaG
VPLPLAHLAGTLGPLQLAPIAIVAVAYALRARTLAGEGRPVAPWRQLCFAGGVALVVAAIVSPLSHVGRELLVVHMAQHLVLADLAALLLVLGLTGPLLQPLLATRALGWLRALGHPLVALPLWAANLYVWHIPALYQGALSSGPVHALEHGCFLGFGVAMWMALLGPLPKPAWFGNGARLGYIVVVRMAGAVLGNVMIWSGSVLYPDYAPGEAYWHVSPLADQGAAGTAMMIESGFVTLGLFVWLFYRAAREGEEKQELMDLAAQRGLDLDERRAGRAVAAGQGERLRERIAGGER